MAGFQAPKSLVLLAQSGDRKALGELFRGIQQALFRYLAGCVGNEHLAEDILQDVFVLVWRKLRWLRDPELFRPWVFRIATREAFRHLKRLRSQALQLDPAPIDLVAEQRLLEAEKPAWLPHLPELLASVSPASRAVLILHYQQGLTLEEVAGILDIPLGTVKSRLAYGLSVLRQKIRNQETPDEETPSKW